LFTTCLGVDDDILLDAGTGLTGLSIDQLLKIDHVFLTHSHLDHVAGLALLLDAIQGKKSNQVTVYATDAVIAALKKHLFNWRLWPDFTQIPNKVAGIFRWQTMALESPIDLNGRLITAYSVNHTPGSAAYWVRRKQEGFLFTGDMGATPTLWAGLSQKNSLSKVIIDCSFSNNDADLAARSMHFCPRSLMQDIRTMPSTTEFLIYHLKPGQEDLIMDELHESGEERIFKALKRGDCFSF